MAVSKRRRFECFKRDGFTCQYCGQKPPAVVLNCDHIVPSSKGGGDELYNLVTSCFPCNAGKSDVSLNQIPESLHDSIEREKERRAQVKAYNTFLMKARRQDEEIIETLGRHWYNQFEKEKDAYVFGPSRVASIKTFLKRLAPVEIMEAMEIAHAKIVAWRSHDNSAWKYFCGICWKTIKRQGGTDAEHQP